VLAIGSALYILRLERRHAFATAELSLHRSELQQLSARWWMHKRQNADRFRGAS